MIRRITHQSVLALVLALVSLIVLSCEAPEEIEAHASARVATQRSDLLGGIRALGALGDIVIENDQIRAVIQREGFSRGFGVYGGSLIDATLRRPGETGNAAELFEDDRLGELFPAFFLQAMAVNEVVIINDGSDGEAAVVESRGTAGDFLELAGLLNRLAVGSHEVPGDPESPQNITYLTRYVLAPGARHIEITFEATNTSEETLIMPTDQAGQLLGVLGLNLDGFAIPVGDVALFGNASQVFVPGAGYDVRFALEDAYALGLEFPAFPGLITDFVAARSDGISYGLAAASSENNYLATRPELYGEQAELITDSSMLIPFVASGFLGVFYAAAPEELGPGETVSVTKYFIIGDGDVGSILDELYAIRGTETGRIGGQVIDEVTGSPADDVQVFVYQRRDDGSRRIFSQYDVTSRGAFEGRLEPGPYSFRTWGPGRGPGDFVDFEVRGSEQESVRLVAPSPGRITVDVVDEAGRRLPSKSVAVGSYDAQFAGELTREFLFDLSIGMDWRASDLVPDEAEDPATRRYIEATAYGADGAMEMHVRPGTYQVYSSRGPEYDVAVTEVTVGAGETVSVGHTVSRVVDTPGWISMDVHVHSINSIDSGYALTDRVVALAAEGVEWPVATDHNYVTDYGPTIETAGLIDWMRSSVGLELTTLESGHFNGYPLDYEVGNITNGAFEWARRPPGELFDELRSRGAYGPENTIVQVNHPRDTILGYFNQYNRDALTTEVIEPSLLDQLIGGLTGGGSLDPTGPAFVDEEGETVFSFEFDALEIVNGKLFWQIHHYRVPSVLPEGEIPNNIPDPGTILLDDDDEVAFPGVIDDWYNMLNLGYRYVGVGSSDSHNGEDEAGYFRTMVYVGEDDVTQVEELELIQALRNARRAIATNGPMIDFTINDDGVIGSEIADPDGAVSINVTLTAAPWVSVARINVVRNGVIAQAIEVDASRDLAADPVQVTLDLQMAQNEEGDPIDSWFLVEAIGYESFFPMVRPLELPPLDLTDAIGSLAGPLGLGDAEFGALMPAETFPVTAYGITNPVWVRGDGDDEWNAPGVVPFEIRSEAANDPGFDNNPIAKDFLVGELIDPNPVRYVESVTPVRRIERSIFSREPMGERDVRRLIQTFDRGHAH